MRTVKKEYDEYGNRVKSEVIKDETSLDVLIKLTMWLSSLMFLSWWVYSAYWSRQ